MSARYDQAICFAAVAELGSFTRAATQLERSKAHVSKQVSALEEALGVQLLLRTTRRLVLTEAGRTYLDYCKQLRETLLEGERAVSEIRRDVTGTLRLTAPTALGDAFLLDLLLAFQHQHPKVKVELDLSIHRRDLVGEGYDFAIRTTRTLDDQLVVRALGTVRDIPVASPALLAAHPTVRHPDDLRALPCMTNTHFRDDPEWVFRRGDETTAVRVGGAFAVNHFGMLLRAAIRGAGVVRLPHYLVASAIVSGQLVHLLPDFELPPSAAYLVYPQRRHMPFRNRVFRDFVVNWFTVPERAALLS